MPTTGPPSRPWCRATSGSTAVTWRASSPRFQRSVQLARAWLASTILEAEITGGREHPGIVAVYGLGTYDGGRPYYAMRFIQGDSLKESIEKFQKDVRLKRDPGQRSLE